MIGETGSARDDPAAPWPAADAAPIFESAAVSVLLDYFRVPYEVDAHAEEPMLGLPARHPLRSCPWLRAKGQSSPILHWLSRDAAGTAGNLSAGAHRIGALPLHGHVLRDSVTEAWLQQTNAEWRRSLPIYSADGAVVASVWKSSDEATFLPFDPDEIIENHWSERYQTLGAASRAAGASRLARGTYYRIRPLLPRRLQLALRRLFTRVQSRASFPRWPVETALHEFYAFFLGAVAELTPESIPWVAPWPKPYSWAFVLTHDVEHTWGYQNVHLLRDVELATGYRSSWHFVPLRDYRVDLEDLQALTEAGFEVGVHGLHHDGRDIAPALHEERFPRIREYAEQWNASGFRSPSTLRVWELMPLLGFDHDSSYSDTAPFEPQPGGCCSWLPYMIDDLVELPITLPQDQTVFELFRRQDEQMWVDKAKFLKAQGGMALILVHPDYVPEGPLLDAYRRFLETFAADSSAWKCLPRDVSEWWRRRAASSLVRGNGDWTVVGPASGEAVIRYFSRDEPFPGPS